MTYITEQLPPFNFKEDGELQGISVDLLEMVWQRMGQDLDRSIIELLPWTEGYQRTLNESSTALFLTARLPERELLFKWAGPMISGRYVILARKDRNITMASPKDLGRYRIGAILDDPLSVQLLLDQGAKKDDLILKNSSKPIIEMLEMGSIDAWAYNEITGIWQIREAGLNASNYEAVYVLGVLDAYLAFNKEVPDPLVKSFQEAIDYVKTNKDDNGTTDYERVLARYLHTMPIPDIAKENDAIAFLNEAAAYVRDNGEERALQEFNNSSGSFVRDDLYIFAYDLNGTCIAHPTRPDLVGQRGLMDINGVDAVNREIALAKRGGGTMYIVFQNPTHNGKEELKQIYIEDINDSLYIGTGAYLSNISASFDQEERDDLMAFVREALKFAQENGKQKSLEVFNDPTGNFTRDGRYIFAYDYQGQTLALPYQPELLGVNRIDVQDPNGVYFIQQSIDIAKMGDGFTYYIYPDPSRDMTQALKLSYVANVDDTWFLGSGIYVEGEVAS